MQNTNLETYRPACRSALPYAGSASGRHYIALDWSRESVVVANMRDSSNEPVKKTLPASIKCLKENLKSFSGRKILTIEESSASHWLYVELFEYVDKILICDPYRNHLLKDGPKNDKIDAGKLCMLLRNNLVREVYHSMDKAYEIRKLVSAYQDFQDLRIVRIVYSCKTLVIVTQQQQVVSHTCV